VIRPEGKVAYYVTWKDKEEKTHYAMELQPAGPGPGVITGYSVRRVS
jgi:hypothetical protein